MRDIDKCGKCRILTRCAEQAANHDFVGLGTPSEFRLRQPQLAAPVIQLVQNPVYGSDALARALVLSTKGGILEVSLKILVERSSWLGHADTVTHKLRYGKLRV